MEITINKGLSNTKLEETVALTRRILISTYANCEKHFQIGLEIFEAIVEAQILKTNQLRVGV